MSSRRVFRCQSTWGDRQFKKSFARLSPDRQELFLKNLLDLQSALESASHPATDPHLRQAFRAKSYSGVVQLKGAALLEYSLDNLSRVIAKYPAREGGDDILLVVVTLDHDHERLKRLIKANRSEINEWEDG
ncbi:MAG TPA: hypothetical protein VGS22_18280 [Thermoanaerobaculia bacterium]|nr:hypothetical protein [Thermoanaerobaculia bacterium]